MKKRKKRETISGYDRVMRRTKIPLNNNECWLWCGPVNNAGYGMIRGDQGNPKMTTVHRIVGIRHGLDDEKEIQHTCLTKHCVNPKHLVNGNPMSRNKRIIAKHGRNWQKPKVLYRTCEHCKGTSHTIWFSRMHGDCYPGMLTKYSCNKV